MHPVQIMNIRFLMIPEICLPVLTEHFLALRSELSQHVGPESLDPNMFRPEVVNHPSKYEFCGYNEILKPKERRAIIGFELRRTIAH